MQKKLFGIRNKIIKTFEKDIFPPHKEHFHKEYLHKEQTKKGKKKTQSLIE